MSRRVSRGFPGRPAEVANVTYHNVAIGRCPARQGLGDPAGMPGSLGRVLLMFLLLVAMAVGVSAALTGTVAVISRRSSYPIRLAVLIS